MLEALAALADGGDWAALPAMHALYKVSPTPYRRETGAVVDIAGSNASAKAKWSVLYGHPGERRARPEVVRTIQASVQAITGRECVAPQALRAILRDPEVKSRLQALKR